MAWIAWLATRIPRDFGSMNVLQQSHGRNSEPLDIWTRPVLLMNCQWSREQKWHRVRVSMVSTRTFRRTQIAISAWRRKYRGFLQKTCWYSRAQIGKFGDLITADHKISKQESQSRNRRLYALLWYTIWQHRGYNISRVQNKNFSRDPEEPNEIPGADEETKSHLHWQFLGNSAKFCEDLSWNHCTSTPHRSETNEIAERAVRRVKEGDICGVIATRSVWKNGGRIPWNVTPICETVSDLIIWWEDALWEAIPEIAFKRSSNTVSSNGRTSPYLCEGPVETKSVRSKSLTK